MPTASNSSLKQSCSALTSVTNALEVIFNVMRSINPRFTYLLTYLHNVQHHRRALHAMTEAHRFRHCPTAHRVYIPLFTHHPVHLQLKQQYG